MPSCVSSAQVQSPHLHAHIPPLHQLSSLQEAHQHRQGNAPLTVWSSSSDAAAPADRRVTCDLACFSCCYLWQSELHKNCSSVSELVATASGSSQQPRPPSLHADTDCSWKPFGLYTHAISSGVFTARRTSSPNLRLLCCQIRGTTNSCWEPWTTPSSVPTLWECTSGKMSCGGAVSI